MSTRALLLALSVTACSQPAPQPAPTATPPAKAPEHTKPAQPDVPAVPDMPAELAARGGALLRDNQIDRRIEPWHLQGDFDGDGKLDHVVSLWRGQQSPDKAPQLVVLRGIDGEGRDLWLSDDAELSVPARDSWRVHPKATPVPVGHDGEPVPKLLGDAFVVAKNESSSALIYWTGTRFRSYFLTD